MLTEPIISAIAHLIQPDIDATSADGWLLTESLFREQSAKQWEGAGDTDMRELASDQFKAPTRGNPSIDKEGILLLPTFVDYDFKAVVRGIWNLLQRSGSVVVRGRPGFAYEGETAPYTRGSGNVSIDRAAEMYREWDALVITGINDYPLSEIERMDLAGPESQMGQEDDWLRDIIGALDEFESRGEVEVERYPAIPRKFGAYWAVEPVIRSNAVMLFSKKYGEGFYIVGKRIDGMDWDVAVQAFYRDPESYLERVDIDPGKMTKSRRGRIRLLFRDYLRATEQGAYVNRAGRLDDIVDFVSGEPLEGIPEGLLEHLLYPTYFI